MGERSGRSSDTARLEDEIIDGRSDMAAVEADAVDDAAADAAADRAKLVILATDIDFLDANGSPLPRRGCRC